MRPTLAGTDARGLVLAATDRLRAGGSPSPRLDAELLVAHAFGRDRTWLLAHPEELLEPAAAGDLAGWVERRAGGEPVAYIRGFKEWLSVRVATDRRALIPRPETELLAGAAIEEIAARLVRDDAPIAAWEVATGSGAVSLALALRFRTALALGRVRLAASDLSAEALELASENLEAHGVAPLVSLGCGDLLDPPVLPAPLLPDVVIANLPYLTTAEAASDEGSLRHEPRSALDGGADGLDVVRRLLAQLPDRLAAGGTALLEIGAGQAEAVRRLVADLPVAATVGTLPDLAGIERVVRIDRE
jgi:release factor glutamine methyltransferase